MTENQTPEKFVVGETVTFYHGEDQYPVEVISVDGDEVVAKVFGQLRLFIPRADGKHVLPGEPEFTIMPDMIFHAEPVMPAAEPVKVSLWKRITKKFF